MFATGAREAQRAGHWFNRRGQNCIKWNSISCYVSATGPKCLHRLIVASKCLLVLVRWRRSGSGCLDSLLAASRPRARPFHEWATNNHGWLHSHLVAEIYKRRRSRAGEACGGHMWMLEVWSQTSRCICFSLLNLLLVSLPKLKQQQIPADRPAVIL